MGDFKTEQIGASWNRAAGHCYVHVIAIENCETRGQTYYFLKTSGALEQRYPLLGY